MFYAAADSAKKKVRDVITDFKAGVDKLAFTLFDPKPETTPKIEAFRFATQAGPPALPP